MSNILEKLCTVRYDEELHCVVFTWHGFAASHHLRKIYERVLALVKKHRCNKVLSDNGFMLAFTDDDQNWIVHDWVPRLQKAGIRYSAIIAPSHAMTKSAVDDVVSKVGLQGIIEQRFFPSQDEAKVWLKSLNP